MHRRGLAAGRDFRRFFFRTPNRLAKARNFDPDGVPSTLVTPWSTVLFLVAVGSPAPDASVELEWGAPAGCTTQGGIERRVEGFLGRKLGEVGGEPVHADIRVEVSAQGYSARVTLETAAGSQERRLEDPDCDVLADASAFIVAVAIDPDAAVRALAAAPEPSPSSERPPAIEDVITPTEVRSEEPPVARQPQDRRRPRGIRGAARLGLVGSGGLLPGFAPGVQLAVALLVRRARVEAGGRWHFERSVAVGGDGSASLTLWEVGLTGCYEPGWQKLEFPLCGGLSAGEMRAQSRGLLENGSASIPWLSADLTGGLAYVPVRGVALRADVSARVPLNRPTFTVENLGEVHSSWPVGVSGGLAIEARFP